MDDIPPADIPDIPDIPPVCRGLMGPDDGQLILVPRGEVVQTFLAAGQFGTVITHTWTVRALKRVIIRFLGLVMETMITSQSLSCFTMRDLTVSQVWGMLQLITQEACQGYL